MSLDLVGRKVWFWEKSFYGDSKRKIEGKITQERIVVTVELADGKYTTVGAENLFFSKHRNRKRR